VLHVAHVDDAKDEQAWKVDRYSQHFACDNCGRSFEPLNPHHFSFNSPLGWCPTCEGLGVQLGRGRHFSFGIRNCHCERARSRVPDLKEDADSCGLRRRWRGMAAFRSIRRLRNCSRAAAGIVARDGDAWISLNGEARGKGRRAKEEGPRFQYKGCSRRLTKRRG